MIWETLKKQRRTLRRSIGHIGTIQTEPDARPHYCIVMADFEGGVRISIPHDFELSDKFNLRRYSGKEARYKVIGAQLIGKRREQTTHSVVGAVLNTK